MEDSTVPFFKKIKGSTFFIAGFIVLLIIFSLFLKINVNQKPSPSQKTIIVKVEYKNPFEKKTQYQNPFDEYQNPFDELVFAQTQ